MASPWKTAETGIIVTTTPTVEGRPVQDYLGIVTGEAIIGANMFRDLFAGIRDIVGGRAGSYEKVLKQARHDAIEEMQAELARLHDLTREVETLGPAMRARLGELSIAVVTA